MAGLIVLGMVALADGACTSSTSTVDTFEFSLVGPSAPVPIPSGGTGTAFIGVTNKSEAQRLVKFTAAVVPTGLTVALNPTSTTGDHIDVSISVAPGTPPGIYFVILRGVGDNSIAHHDVTISVSVTPPPGFTLSVPITPHTVTKGSLVNLEVQITRTGGFAGEISLSLIDPLPGLSAYYLPDPVPGIGLSATAVVSAGPTAVAPSSHLVTFKGTSGALEATTQTLINVVAPSLATFDFSSCEVLPIWAAGSSGAEVPSLLSPTGKVYQLAVPGATGTFAFVLPGSPTQLNVFQGTQAELTAEPITPCFPFGSSQVSGGPPHATGTGLANANASSLAGTVAGVGASQLAALLWGNGNAFTTQASPYFSMNNVFGSPHALAGYRKELVGGVSAADRAFMRQNQAAGTGVAVDFNGVESAPVATANATVSGIQGGDLLTVIMAYTTEARCQGIVWYGMNGSAAFQITGIPASLQGANDVHLFSVGFSNGNTFLGQLIRSKALGAFAVTRPTPLATPTVTRITSAGYLGEQAVVNLGAYNAVTLSYSDGAGGHYVSVTASKGFLGGATGTVSTPNLSGVAGWSNAWAPATGAAASWSVMGSSNVEFTPACASGTTLTTAGINGSN